MTIWSVIMALSATSILGITSENYNVTTADFNSSGAVGATLNRTSNDPCYNYTVLNESWRNVNASRPAAKHCDSLLTPGVWYRLLPPAGNAIPETIPPDDSCGADAPMWLNGAHPRYVSSTPVERLLCASLLGVPCMWSTVVQVALCFGGYYVYKAPLNAAPVCDLTWCAVDINPNQTASAICERQGNFYCSLSQLCVSYNNRCDGYSYCSYGEDEAGCATPAAPTTVPSWSCGGVLYGSAYFQSSNYSSNYLNNLNCNWTLIASPYNAYVVLQFDAFSTESCCDFMSIYNSDGSLVTRYSGTNGPSTMVLPDKAIIIFTTDGSGTSSGFSVWFYTSATSVATTVSSRADCELRGNFYCPHSYLCVDMAQRCNGYSYCDYGEDEVDCSTVAPTPTSSRVRDSCLSQGKFYCQIGRTCIYSSWRCDGVSDCLYNEDELGCSGRTSTLSPTNASPSSCGGTLYGSGYVRSPNYPSTYGNDLNCTWTLYAIPYYGNILLKFYDFNTESCCDVLSIYNSNGALVNRYSGTTYPNNVVLRNAAVVTFTTEGSFANSRFSAWFSTSAAATTNLSPRDSCEQQGYFYCALSNLCVALRRRCDGYTYCNYGEDEAGCTSSSTTDTPSVMLSQRDFCLGQGNFYCEYSLDCIPMRHRCDGYSHCFYGDDESLCDETSTKAKSLPAGEQPQGSFIAESSNAQVFLQLSKSSASDLTRGSWIVVSGYIAAWLFESPRFDVH